MLIREIKVAGFLVSIGSGGLRRIRIRGVGQARLESFRGASSYRGVGHLLRGLLFQVAIRGESSRLKIWDFSGVSIGRVGCGRLSEGEGFRGR